MLLADHIAEQAAQQTDTSPAGRAAGGLDFGDFYSS